VCLHLYIPWKFGERGSTLRGARRPSLSFFCLLVCPSRYDARHRKPRRCVYALNLGGTGISPPDSFSFRSSSTTSADILYCSGSRQLNHSSFFCICSTPRVIYLSIVALMYVSYPCSYSHYDITYAIRCTTVFVVVTFILIMLSGIYEGYATCEKLCCNSSKVSLSCMEYFWTNWPFK